MATTDLLLVIGLILTGLAIPSIVGAIGERRSPRIAAIIIMIGGSLIILAITQKPGGYALQDFPQAFICVVGHYLR